MLACMPGRLTWQLLSGQWSPQPIWEERWPNIVQWTKDVAIQRWLVYVCGPRSFPPSDSNLNSLSIYRTFPAPSVVVISYDSSPYVCQCMIVYCINGLVCILSIHCFASFQALICWRSLPLLQLERAEWASPRLDVGRLKRLNVDGSTTCILIFL